MNAAIRQIQDYSSGKYNFRKNFFHRRVQASTRLLSYIPSILLILKSDCMMGFAERKSCSFFFRILRNLLRDGDETFFAFWKHAY